MKNPPKSRIAGPVEGKIILEYRLPGIPEAVTVEHELRSLLRPDLVTAQADLIMHAVAETGTLRA